MNFCKRSYQAILRYLYTEVKKRRGEISLHKHFNKKITSPMNSKDRSFLSHYQQSQFVLYIYKILKFEEFENEKHFFTMNSANVILANMHVFF